MRVGGREDAWTFVAFRFRSQSQLHSLSLLIHSNSTGSIKDMDFLSKTCFLFEWVLHVVEAFIDVACTRLVVAGNLGELNIS